MPDWLALSKGPLFTFVLAFVGLSVLRLICLTLWDIAVAVRRAGDRRLPYLRVAFHTVSSLFPVNKLSFKRLGYTLASLSLHLGVFLVALFLRNHLDILQANVGFAWQPIAKPALDILTLIGFLGGCYLFLYRLYVPNSRHLSKAPDYLLLLLLLCIFGSGYLAGQPWNPIPYNGLMLFHTLNGMLFLLLIPFTKIAHCVLFPLIRLGTEAAWHFTPRASRPAVQALQSSEGRNI